MKCIPLAACICVAFYVILMLLEASLHPAILPGAILGSIVLGILAAIFIWKSDHAKHLGEVILIWIMVLGFISYGLLCFGGII
ncbi:hypothetical protein SDC9_35862 [bioreactor metagenome]|uniref:Uncharacterized protein n=1 Tax=bioreactor metagenome TaxID=1076179 RepID=A0A644VEV7_9ZZZZ|nr:hypothetical protein [Methanocorpusculum sp.]